MPVSYKQLLKIVAYYDYKLISQKWSHQKFSKNGKSFILPKHKELKPKTALSILKQIGNYEKVDFKQIIKEFNLKI